MKYNYINMRYVLFTIILSFAGLVMLGQTNDCQCNYNQSDDQRLYEKLICNVLPAIEAKIPEDELFAQWCYGKVILNSGEVISGVFMHYDGLTDQLIIDSKNPAIKLAVEKYTIRGFDMESFNSDIIFQFRRISVKARNFPEIQDLFLQVLISGINTLYAHRQLLKTLEINKIVRKYNYFIKKEDGSIVSLTKPSRRTFLKLFPEKKEEYRNRLRKLHNHIRNEKQLAMAVELLNNL